MSADSDEPAGSLPTALLLAVVLGVVVSGVVGPVAAATTTAGGSTATATPGERTATDRPTTPATATATPTEASAREATATDASGATDAPPGDATGTALPETTVAVSNLTAPAVVRRGDAVRVAATVTNRRSRPGTAAVTYTFDGTAVATERVRLAGDEWTRVTFRANLSRIRDGGVEPGRYVHGVSNESGDGVGRRTRVTPDVDLAVADLDAPTTVARDRPYVVVGTVANPADAAVTRTVAYEFGDAVVAERPVTVAAGDRETVAFRVDPAAVANVTGGLTTGATYRHGVAAPGGAAASGAVRIVGPGSAAPDALAVENFTGPDVVRTGEAVAAEATLRNVAEAPFEGQVAYRVDGTVLATEWVRIPVGENRTLTFEVGADRVRRTLAPAPADRSEQAVRAGDESLATRPVALHLETATPTPRSTVRLADGEVAGTEDAEGGAEPGETATGTESSSVGTDARCRRGFVSRCGGLGIGDVTITTAGSLASIAGILVQLTRGSR